MYICVCVSWPDVGCMNDARDHAGTEEQCVGRVNADGDHAGAEEQGVGHVNAARDHAKGM